MRYLFILITIAFNVAVSWLFSKLVGWSFMESMFLSGLLMFGIVWFVLLGLNRSTNMMDATIKGTTGISTGEMKTFKIQFNPFIIGSIVYLFTSAVITFIYYLPYFTS